MKIGVCGIACEVCPRMVRGVVPQWRGGLPSKGEQDVPGCHLRLSKRRRFVLQVPGISLRDDKAGADKLRILSVHLRPGSLGQSFIFFTDND